MLKTKVVSMMLSAVLLIGSIISPTFGITAYADEGEMTDVQRNAIAMLNYITVMTQEINESKNSRLYLEKAYSELINNTYPNAIDSMTKSQLTGLLDVMEAYRMTDVKRERLKYIYEQNQAQAIREAVPNPIGVLSAAASFNPKRLIGAIVYMAVDSITSYTAYTEQSELEYLKDRWALDDEEADTLHKSRKRIFSYMVDMVSEFNLPGDLTLTEKTVKDFVKWKNDKNNVGRIRFLESNEDVYKAYGGYWLTLAESYYNNEDYDKCIEAIKSYQDLDVRIVRKDYPLANILPLGITSASECMDENEYIETAAPYAQAILVNTDLYDWSLRYFAAQTFLDLYSKTSNDEYLEKAYNIALDNCNYLVAEQVQLNEDYLSPIKEEEIPDDATDEQEEEIEKYNDLLEDERETALPPVYEPLRINCDLLFGIVSKMDLPDIEKRKIDKILHLNDDPLFFTQQLEEEYWQLPISEDEEERNAEVIFSGGSLILPAVYLSDKAQIKVFLQEEDAEEEIEVSDWKINEVHREKEDDISTFEAAYKSKRLGNYYWDADTKIRIEVEPYTDRELPGYQFDFVAKGTKEEWYDWLMPWEGHKNNWYDYLMVWDNSVEFEQVEK